MQPQAPVQQPGGSTQHCRRTSSKPSSKSGSTPAAQISFVSRRIGAMRETHRVPRIGGVWNDGSSQPLDDMYALCPSWRLRSITTSPELAKPKEIGRRLSDQALSSALNGVRRGRRHVVVRRGIRDGSDVPAKCISGRRSRPTSRPVRQRRYLTHRRQSPNRTMIRSASLPG